MRVKTSAGLMNMLAFLFKKQLSARTKKWSTAPAHVIEDHAVFLDAFVEARVALFLAVVFCTCTARAGGGAPSAGFSYFTWTSRFAMSAWSSAHSSAAAGTLSAQHCGAMCTVRGAPPL
jgi:hypothetical protein